MKLDRHCALVDVLALPALRTLALAAPKQTWLALPTWLDSSSPLAFAFPMNYRHAFHAGNFADVLKHAVLAYILSYMKRKGAPFRVIDTHAGRGAYDLGSGEALRTGEWRDGIGRLLGAEAHQLPDEVAALVGPYLDIVRAVNAPGRLAHYPGSPQIAQSLLRADDRLIANELHPEDRAELVRTLGRDPRVHVMGLDGWTALKSLLPPRERRGLVLVDPPFEEPGELDRMVEGVRNMTRRFAGGVAVMWYPIKGLEPIRRFERGLAALSLPKLLRAELLIRSASDSNRLNGCGLILANPPYTLPELLVNALPRLAGLLSQGAGASASSIWLGSERK
jgi:23S rRNA (adenine2030-N6)-methyltransferase